MSTENTKASIRVVNTTSRNVAESTKNTVKTISSLSYRNNIMVDVPPSQNILIRSNVTKNKLYPLLSPRRSNNTGNHSMVRQNMKKFFTNHSADKSHPTISGHQDINQTVFLVQDRTTTAPALFYSKAAAASVRKRNFPVSEQPEKYISRSNFIFYNISSATSSSDSVTWSKLQNFESSLILGNITVIDDRSRISLDNLTSPMLSESSIEVENTIINSVTAKSTEENVDNLYDISDVTNSENGINYNLSNNLQYPYLHSASSSSIESLDSSDYTLGTDYSTIMTWTIGRGEDNGEDVGSLTTPYDGDVDVTTPTALALGESLPTPQPLNVRQQNKIGDIFIESPVIKVEETINTNTEEVKTSITSISKFDFQKDKNFSLNLRAVNVSRGKVMIIWNQCHKNLRNLISYYEVAFISKIKFLKSFYLYKKL